MYEIGELVVYGRNGICEVKDISTIEMAGIPNDKLYYILRPYREKDGKIFTPVAEQKMVLRRIITKEEAEQLIEEIPQIEEMEIKSEKLREDIYKECLASCRCREWIRMIKTLRLRTKRRAAIGKKITTTDEKYLRLTESSLFAEFSLVLGIPEKEVGKYIGKQLETFEASAS